MTCKISSANMGFGSANSGRYYTVQQLIAQLSSARGQTTVKHGKSFITGTVVQYGCIFYILNTSDSLKYPAVPNDYLCNNLYIF